MQKAKDKYSEDKNLNAYIAFWEMIWANAGLKLEGTRWHFKLPNLYIKARKYDNVFAFVIKLKKTKPTYAYKSDSYTKKIQD